MWHLALEASGTERLAAAGDQGWTAEQPRTLGRPPPGPAREDGLADPCVLTASSHSSLQESPLSPARGISVEWWVPSLAASVGLRRAGPGSGSVSVAAPWGLWGKVQDPQWF